MRFINVFQEALATLEQKLPQKANVCFVVTCEKQSDILEGWQRLFPYKMSVKNLERSDREILIQWLIENESKI